MSLTESRHFVRMTNVAPNIQEIFAVRATSVIGSQAHAINCNPKIMPCVLSTVKNVGWGHVTAVTDSPAMMRQLASRTLSYVCCEVSCNYSSFI